MPPAYRTVVVAGGHRTDEPGRAEPRFPESAVPSVSAAIARVLAYWELGPGDLLVTGGARGADLLAAEAALGRGASVQVLLAYPVDEFVDRSVRLRSGRADAWDRRFREALEMAEVRIQDEHGLRDGETRFERNNRWCVETASAAASPGALRGLLVWDGRTDPDRRGGTANLAAELARTAADVEIIDPASDAR